MKKLLSLLLILATLLAIAGCQKPPQAEDPDQPVRFYYCRTGELPFGSADSVITHEVRSGVGLLPDSQLLLSEYLKGPESEDLASPFPYGLQLLSLREKNGIIYVTLSDDFAALSGLDLTLACVCLAKTAGELQEAKYVIIKAKTLPLAGNKQILISLDNLLFLDDSATNPPTTTTP